MIVFVPHKRISAIEALHHSYFQEFGLAPSLSESELLPHTDLTSTISDTSDNETFQDEEPLTERTEETSPTSPRKRKESVGEKNE